MISQTVKFNRDIDLENAAYAAGLSIEEIKRTRISDLKLRFSTFENSIKPTAEKSLTKNPCNSRDFDNLNDFKNELVKAETQIKKQQT